MKKIVISNFLFCLGMKLIEWKVDRDRDRDSGREKINLNNFNNADE